MAVERCRKDRILPSRTTGCKSTYITRIERNIYKDDMRNPACFPFAFYIKTVLSVVMLRRRKQKEKREEEERQEKQMAIERKRRRIGEVIEEFGKEIQKWSLDTYRRTERRSGCSWGDHTNECGSGPWKKCLLNGSWETKRSWSSCKVISASELSYSWRSIISS